jgi:hypothetical protein
MEGSMWVTILCPAVEGRRKRRKQKRGMEDILHCWGILKEVVSIRAQCGISTAVSPEPRTDVSLRNATITATMHIPINGSTTTKIITSLTPTRWTPKMLRNGLVIFRRDAKTRSALCLLFEKQCEEKRGTKKSLISLGKKLDLCLQ